jgi:hypothetical protein
MLKRLASFFLWVWIGFIPIEAFATSMLLTGAGGGVPVSVLAPPTILPQPSASFSPSNSFGSLNIGLLPNQGTAGAFQLPANPLNSWNFYYEGTVSPVQGSFTWAFGSGNSTGKGIAVSGATAGNPVVVNQFQAFGFGTVAFPWWTGSVAIQPLTSVSQLSYTKGTNYNPGIYAATAGDGCPEPGSRKPSFVIEEGSVSGSWIADPGWNCGQNASGANPTVNFSTISKIGPTQSTNSTTCTPLPHNQIQITTHLANDPGLVQGQSFALTGFTTTPANVLNSTFAVTSGSPGTAVVGFSGANSGVCPTISSEGSLTGGTGGALSINSSVIQTNPFGMSAGGASGTGIQVNAGQRICALTGQAGIDSAAPGFAYAKYTGIDGVDLPGSPAISTRPNMNVGNFTGYTTLGTQAPTSPALTVTAMNAYPISTASYDSGTGFVTFTMSQDPGFQIGSEFQVSGVSGGSGAGFNVVYIAVAGTSGTTIKGNPLSGPGGLLSPNNPGASSGTGGQMTSVITPGEYVVGSSPSAMISPYGTFGATGRGSIGTYGLSTNQATFSVAGSIAPGGVGGTATFTVTGTPTSQVAAGTNLSSPATGGSFVTAPVSGTGGAGTYGVNVSQTKSGPFPTSGGLGSSSNPVSIYAADAFYYRPTPSGTAPGGGALTSNSQSTIGDFINLFGSESNAATALLGNNAFGWGGNLGNVGMFEGGPFPLITGGAPDPTSFNQLCGKLKDFKQWAADLGGAWRSLYTLKDGGQWADNSVADVSGYLSGASGTVAGTATLNVSSLVAGSLATSLNGTAVLAGPGVPGCPSKCPTFPTGAGPTYAVTFGAGVTSANAGSSGSPISMMAGNFKPAAPLGQLSFNGTLAGGTLTVNSIPALATFTGALNGTALTVSGVTGTALAQGQCINGAGISPLAPLCIISGSGSNWVVNTNLYGPIAAETMTTGITSIIPGQYVTGSGISSPVLVTGYGTGAGGVGTYNVDNQGGLSLGPQTMVMSGVGSGGAIAPGAALSVKNPGVGATFPLTNIVSESGSIPLTGTFSNALLHGNPDHIQAQVSLTPQGPPVSGCSACTWTNVSNESINVGPGTWAGTITNIPVGGPYWVSLRASNGTSYATLANQVFVGFTIALFGEGNTSGWFTNTAGTLNQTNFVGLSQLTGLQAGAGPATWATSGNFVPGPPIINNFAISHSGQVLIDDYAINGSSTSINDGMAWFAQNISDITGAPAAVAGMFKDGTSFAQEWYGYVPSTQTIGVGDGSTVRFSSGAGYGGSTGNAYVTPPATATATVSTAGILNVTSTQNNPFSYIDVGQQVTCSLAGCPAGMTIVGQGGPWEPTLTGIGSVGTYRVSPAPTSAVASGNIQITNNNLFFNGAWGFGATINGSVASGVLTVNSVLAGVIAPLLNVSDGSNSAQITACKTGCGPLVGAGSRWQLSSSALNGDTSLKMSIIPPGGVLFDAALPAPTVNIPVDSGGGGTLVGSTPLIKHGTFSVLVGGASYCSDSASSFFYNQQVGTCLDFGSNNRGWVNYTTGAYSLNVTPAPASGVPIVGQWTNIMSGNGSGLLSGSNNTDVIAQQIDFVGDGSSTTEGALTAVAATTGGVNAFFNGQQYGSTSATNNWPDVMLQAARQNNYFFGTRMAKLHNGQPNAPMLGAGQWRGVGTQAMLQYFAFTANYDDEQYFQDAGTKSEFNGSISNAGGTTGAWTATLTLTSTPTGRMWEGEALECNPFSTSCALPQATEIVGLCTVALCGAASPQAWGVSGSTYQVTTDFNAFSTMGSTALHNAIYYPGGAYVGPGNDLVPRDGGPQGGYAVEPGGGIIGALRLGHRMGIETGAALSGHPEKGSTPTLDRTVFSACDTSAQISPCFGIDNSYSTIANPTAISGAVMTFDGLTAGTIPIVDGQAVTCSGCNANLVVVSISNPPTQSTVAGAGQIGAANNGWTVTLNAAPGVTGTGQAFTFGCKGTAGTGSNCIYGKVDINTTGIYGTTAALNTCGVNNIVGTNTNPAPFYSGTFIYPNGQCVPTGVGSFVRGFRIGTNPLTDAQQATGSPYDFGVDPGNIVSGLNQSLTFTCNLVDKLIFRCVAGPVYSHGVYSSIGQWLSGQTFISYGDPNNAAGFVSGLMGFPGGQSFGFTAGSGYTPGDFVAGGVCPLTNISGSSALAPGMGFNVSAGGLVVNAYPTIMGSGTNNNCTFPLSFGFVGSVSGYSSISGQANLIVPTSSLTISGTIPAPTSGQSIITVSNTPTVVVAGGQVLTAANVPIPLTVLALGTGGTTGTGGAGTYAVANFNTAAITPTANTLTNSTLASATIVPGEVISGITGVTNATVVRGPTTGLGGTYVIRCSAPCSAATGANLTSGPTAGSGGSILAITVGPTEGKAGFATFDTDNNMTGTLMYDNSGIVGNPLQHRFDIPSGGLESPGLPIRPFGMRRGARVSG